MTVSAIDPHKPDNSMHEGVEKRNTNIISKAPRMERVSSKSFFCPSKTKETPSDLAAGLESLKQLTLRYRSLFADKRWH